MSGDRRTIVGGRSSGSDGRKDFPRGIEILLKKAKVDPDFQELLLRDPFGAADSIELALKDSERRILAHTPKAVLLSMIRNTFVPRQHAPSFLTQKAPALLLLLLASTVALDASGKSEGVDATPFAYTKEEATDKMVLVQRALEQYKTEHGGYPTTEEWLAATNPLEGYIETSYLYDPWKRKFHYEGVATEAGAIESYRLESLGEDPEDPYDNIPSPIEPERHRFGEAE